MFGTKWSLRFSPNFSQGYTMFELSSKYKVVGYFWEQCILSKDSNSHYRGDNMLHVHHNMPYTGGGGGSLPLEAVQMLENKHAEKGYPKQGCMVAELADRERVSKSRKMGKRVIQIAMSRVLAMRSYVERVGLI